MRNHYDLLGVRPGDDAEKLRTAFRKAAKASHPDHHGGDAQAAARFRQITEAYEILRDAKRRAAYDRLLEKRRRPLRANLKRATRDLRRHIVTDMIVGVVLTIALAGGYEIYARMPQAATGEKTAAAKTPAGPAAASPISSQVVASHDTGGPKPPMLIPAAVSTGGVPSAAEDHGASGLTKGESALPPAGLSPAGPVVEAREPGPDTPVSEAPHSLTGSSAAGKRDRRTPDSRGRDSAGPATADVKLQEPRTSARARIAKRQPAGRPPMEQASLEHRAAADTRAASDAPRGDIPPLFGVGN
jgi:hypothetical protein